MDLEAYRGRAQDFLAAFVAERNDFHAGLKDRLELEEIFQGFADLFEPEAVGALFSQFESASPKDRLPRRHLLAFAVRNALSLSVAKEDQEISAQLKESRRQVDGESFDLHGIEIELSKESRRPRREELWKAKVEIQAETDAVRVRRLEILHETARELSGLPYLECMQLVMGVHFPVLRSQLEAFLSASKDKYMRGLELFLAKNLEGLQLERASIADFPFLLRGQAYDQVFPGDRLLSVLKRTLMGLGIDLKKQTNIRIDAEERAGKNSDAACFGIQVPQKIYLVLRPHGGLRDYLALFRKTGHALHLGHTSPELPFEYRSLGDAAVGETYGALFQYLTLNPEWLEDLLGISESRDVVEYQRFRKLLFLRLYAARFLFEMELHESGGYEVDELKASYRQWTEKALGVPTFGSGFLADLENPFYGTAFLRAWIFEAELRQNIEERFGRRWYSRPAAGNFLKDLWGFGTRYNVEQLAKQIRWMDLDLEPLKRDLT